MRTPARKRLHAARRVCYGSEVGKSQRLDWGPEDTEPDEDPLSGWEKLRWVLLAVVLGAIFHQTVLKWLLR